MPTNWNSWVGSINYWPFVYMLTMGGVGTLCAYWYRRAAWAGLAVRSLACAVVAGTLALHLLTQWILEVDPRRDTGNIPLPSPFPGVTSALLVAFILPGLFWQGLLLGSLARPERDVVSTMWKTSYIIAIGYSLWILPWALGIITD